MLSQLRIVTALTSRMKPNSYSVIPNFRRSLRMSFPVLGDGGDVAFLEVAFFFLGDFRTVFLAVFFGVGRLRGVGESVVSVFEGIF